MAHRNWTISNGLSFLRILLVIPIAVLLLQPEHRMLVVGLLLFAALTDLFDGYLARMLNEVSDFGKIIDPLADKIAVGVVCLILMVQGKVPLWFFSYRHRPRNILIFLEGFVHPAQTRRYIAIEYVRQVDGNIGCVFYFGFHH